MVHWSREPVAKAAMVLEERRAEFWKQRNRISGSLEAKSSMVGFGQSDEERLCSACFSAIFEFFEDLAPPLNFTPPPAEFLKGKQKNFWG